MLPYCSSRFLLVASFQDTNTLSCLFYCNTDINNRRLRTLPPFGLLSLFFAPLLLYYLPLDVSLQLFASPHISRSDALKKKELAQGRNARALHE